MTLTVDAVRWSVAGAAIVRDVSLHCAPGGLVRLIGPNGSRKSSLLRCIYRVLQPDAGTIQLDDHNVWQLNARAAAQQIAVVLQEAPAEFDFSVREMVLMGRTPHTARVAHANADDHAVVDAALAQVGMAVLAERSFLTLSGGEKQRVLVARALAQRPRFLVLDEPTITSTSVISWSCSIWCVTSA